MNSMEGTTRSVLATLFLVSIASAGSTTGVDESSPQPLLDRERNLLTDGGFEGEYTGKDYPATGPTHSWGWIILPRDNEPPRYWGLTTETAVEGKRSMKLTDETGSQNWHLRLTPRMSGADFKGPYRVSCFIRTSGQENPSIVPVWFGIDARSRGNGKGRRFTVATAGPQTEWTHYSKIVRRSDMRFAPDIDYYWTVSIQVRRGFKGSVWIDDVQLIPVDEPTLTFTIDPAENFVSRGEIILRGCLNADQLPQGDIPLTIRLMDPQNQLLHSETKTITDASFQIPLNIAQLPEGNYLVEISVNDIDGNTIRQQQLMTRIADW